MARWADIESYLTILFQRLSGLNEENARLIFHSASSWRGRRNMISAALSSFRSKPGHVRSLHRVLGVCNQYAASRNDLAHGSIRMVRTIGGHRYLSITPMKTPFGPVIPNETLSPYNVQAIASNFLLLGGLIVTCFEDHTEQASSPERVEMLADLLPIPAHSNRLDPIVAEQFLSATPDHGAFLW